MSEEDRLKTEIERLTLENKKLNIELAGIKASEEDYARCYRELRKWMSKAKTELSTLLKEF